MTTYEMIIEALHEAMILESASDVYREDHMLLNAMRLSGAPWFLIMEVYNKQGVDGYEAR